MPPMMNALRRRVPGMGDIDATGQTEVQAPPVMQHPLMNGAPEMRTPLMRSPEAFAAVPGTMPPAAPPVASPAPGNGVIQAPGTFTAAPGPQQMFPRSVYGGPPMHSNPIYGGPPMNHGFNSNNPDELAQNFLRRRLMNLY